ncbi:hypothetical protein GNF83_17920, partial [Clostridium perfringens]|nr:hypothetical protein [Clostridium perfringens]
AYNKINGVYATEHEYLLEHVLRERWGFEGVVVSDWGAVNDKPASVRAGMALQMPGRNDAGARKLASRVRSGEFPEALLDRAVRRILRLAAEVDSHRRMGASFDAEAHHQLAREAAAECIVLLKNEAGLLPLHPDRQQHVAVIGRFAREPRFQGAGSSQIVPTQVDSALAELEQL